MTSTRRRFLGTATAVTVAGLTGCLGGDGADPTPTGTETATRTATATEAGSGESTATEADQPSATVQVLTHPDHGEVLVGPDEMTLYMFDADTQGEGASACPGIEGCNEAWPPLAVDRAEEVEAGPNVSAELSTFEREDGTVQVTANGWPLYYFAQDEARGDAAGQGVNDAWWVLGPEGAPKRPPQAEVAVRSHDEHGDVLVDGDGMTLYVFDSDEQGANASTCTGGCLDAWPPLTTGRSPAVGDGVSADVTTFEREDGTTQVAADGWPLYYFAQDEQPGDVAGQGVNDAWWVLGPDGQPKRATMSDGAGGGGGDGGGGGGGGGGY